MQSVEEDAPKVEAINGDAINHRPEHAGQGSRWHRRQGRPQFRGNMSGGSPSSGGGHSD